MVQIKAAFLERELMRGMRPDARNFLRPDWRRDIKPRSDLHSVFELYERKFRPDQARVPSGSRDGGQWTDEDGSNSNGADGTRRGEGGTKFEVILHQAKKIAASRRTGYLRCLDVGSPLLERVQRPGSERNQWDFHR
jgi:hypothetical protein